MPHSGWGLPKDRHFIILSLSTHLSGWGIVEAKLSVLGIKGGRDEETTEEGGRGRKDVFRGHG